MSENLSAPTRYDASLVESKWYDRWEKAGLFKPDPDPSKTPFTITIPPPNITGSLHMGHALCYPLQDAVGRYRRLKGDSVLILPGQDHAGIATQSVVDKQLKKQGLSAAKIGREAFVEKVWEWRKESGDTILHQFRVLGCAFDWSRQKFTLDQDYADAVYKVFFDWFDRGLIFRGKRVVNWDPALETSVSDIETERKPSKGKLYFIRYPFEDGSGQIVIATTRPETMLADVAVAVHPSDRRYDGLVGKLLRLPLVGRLIPLIADTYPDPEFGSGAVKITPAHDANDYLVGRRHDLDSPVMLDSKARVTEIGGVYAGLDRYEARKRIVADLEEGGFLDHIEDHDIPLLVSERSGEPIEPLLSEQWFVDQPKLAQAVLESMQSGDIRFTPQRFDRIFVEWLENIREWCISRQLWWGHRIPVYYAEDGTFTAAPNAEQAATKLGKPIVRQEEDVLDTWFSSGLWPFATLGWPAETADLKARYPTDVLITDRNIINLWVARMAFMGLDVMKEKPFSQVMIYATVLNEHGQRMSKSLGTGVDPMGIIETLGADALRWTLQSQTGDNQDIRFSPKKTEDARNFCNKIWNASRFVLMNLDDNPSVELGQLAPEDLWLISRTKATIEAVEKGYDSFDFQLVCQALYRYFWNDVCDWYIEIAKPRLQKPETKQTPQALLLRVLEAFLTMLHPVMPHITEEIYSFLPLPKKSEFLMSAPWPKAADWQADASGEAKVERAFEVVRQLRSLRTAISAPALKQIDEAFFVGDLEGLEEIVRSQSWVRKLTQGKPAKSAMSASTSGVTLYLEIDESVDRAAEAAKASADIEKAMKERLKVAARLSDPNFVERAKPEVVEKERATLVELDGKIEALQNRLIAFKSD